MIIRIHLYVALIVLLAACGKSEPVEQAHDDAAAPEHHEEESGHIALSLEQAQKAGIAIETAGPAAIREVLPLYGSVQPNAERVREVTARYPGVVLSVNAKVGDAVRQGQTLATVESNESLRTYQVVAPLGGVITARSVNPGETAGDAPLFTVADLSTVWVELALFPRDLPKVKVGQAVRVHSSDAGLADEGKVVYVAALGQAASQTLTARVLLKNAERRWAPGLYVTGEVLLSQAPVQVAVKSSALQTVGTQSSVFVHTDEGFEAKPVRTGRTDGEYTEVIEGLTAGEQYAASNSFILKSELGKGDAGHDH